MDKKIGGFLGNSETVCEAIKTGEFVESGLMDEGSFIPATTERGIGHGQAKATVRWRRGCRRRRRCSRSRRFRRWREKGNPATASALVQKANAAGKLTVMLEESVPNFNFFSLHLNRKLNAVEEVFENNKIDVGHY